MRPKKTLLASTLVVFIAACASAVLASCGTLKTQNLRTETPAPPWRFVVAGDSRNCGDVIMPSIAAAARDLGATFYWHLGDFRALYKIDEDIAARPEYKQSTLTFDHYLEIAWPDFIHRQLEPFGDLPVFLAIGNHELVHKTRAEYLTAFKSWLTAPQIQTQRAREGGSDVQTYYDWRVGGIEFITLDNASDEQLDDRQMTWLRGRIAEASADPAIQTVVLGMHEALPDSLSRGHSMSSSKNPVAVSTGRGVYHLMLKLQNESHKHVYVLASHSHYFMEGIFNTPYWETHGGILPGWIDGTAGAERIELPRDAHRATRAISHTYGYLVATVGSDGSISFEFRPITRAQILDSVEKDYGGSDSQLVNFCFNANAMKKGYE